MGLLPLCGEPLLLVAMEQDGVESPTALALRGEASFCRGVQSEGRGGGEEGRRTVTGEAEGRVGGRSRGRWHRELGSRTGSRDQLLAWRKGNAGPERQRNKRPTRKQGVN
jgi:hypothetical protein